MIKRIKLKFIILFTTSLFILLVLMVLGMNIMGYRSVMAKADSTLHMLLKERPNAHLPGSEQNDRPPYDPLPNVSHEFQYFSIAYDLSGNIISININNISSIEQSDAVEYGNDAINSDKSDGMIGRFRFARSTHTDEVHLIFIDCGRQLDSYYSFLYASCVVAFAVFIVVSLIVTFFAGRILKPIVESYEKQKRFVTDAGHEIKTPLAVISANVDVLEFDIGKNECLDDIRQQTQRLTSLTNELVYLSRMDETENNMQMIEFPISDAVKETVEAFRLPAQAQRKAFVCNIQPMLSINGNYKAIQQLVSILMDNALKYSSDNGTIELSLERHGKYILLCVSNSVTIPLERDELLRIFDRFYRFDPSRNSETGGHGIGLSIAKAIVMAHNGKIRAEMQDEDVFKLIVMLPSD